ncbi:TonB family protein [Alteromonas sp. 5E99-2]|uniref:M56 family metallopeptidase n=1 Tax=Alteromonas sp. 5E99-2 TaxID=2817683 RepID=UPI001A9915AE|nr:TonB family protein [Alteromonas sp. 5E99-2]MBO1254727.1 TonB family protein [Alteromonas sp. 5E99-2]
MLYQSFFSWLVSQQLLISLMLIIFVLSARFGLSLFGARFVYRLVWLAPLAVLVVNLPSTFKPLSDKAISHYIVTSDTSITTSFSVDWASVYFTITGLMLVAIASIHFRYVKGLKLAKHPKTTMNTPAKVYLSNVISTPMVVGIFNSKLVLPRDYKSQFNENMLSLIVEHENIHIKRKDNFINTLLLGGAILLWFNPLVWMTYAYARRLQELTCDDQVLANKSIQEHILYSKALVHCAEHKFARLIAFSHYGDKKMMIQRLSNIQHKGNPSVLAKTSLLFIAACMLSGLAFAKQPMKGGSDKDHISPIKRVEPLYPSEAAQQGIGGSVVLKYDIDARGNTSNISVVSATPNSMFNTSAKNALAKWQYEPSKNGFKDLLVQLDFKIDTESAKLDLVERIEVLNEAH